MFKHRIDPEVQSQLSDLRDILQAAAKDIENLFGIAHKTSQTVADLDARVTHLSEDISAVEQKLDEVLKAQDVASRSIPGEQPKPEPLNAMPGHIPWSSRKRAREQASRSSNFIEKVKKGAAMTETKESENE
jgi:chromosome segregation ATPase